MLERQRNTLHSWMFLKRIGKIAEEIFDIYGDRNEKYLILTRYTRHDAYTDFL